MITPSLIFVFKLGLFQFLYKFFYKIIFQTTQRLSTEHHSSCSWRDWCIAPTTNPYPHPPIDSAYTHLTSLKGVWGLWLGVEWVYGSGVGKERARDWIGGPKTSTPVPGSPHPPKTLIPNPDLPYHPMPSRSVPGTPPHPSQPIHTHLRPFIPTKTFNIHLGPSTPT